jgi:putative tricarboxylic transport membrane protein
VKARDLIFGITTVVVAILYYGVAATIPPSELADPVGPQGLPKTYAVLQIGRAHV